MSGARTAEASSVAGGRLDSNAAKGWSLNDSLIAASSLLASSAYSSSSAFDMGIPGLERSEGCRNDVPGHRISSARATSGGTAGDCAMRDACLSRAALRTWGLRLRFRCRAEV